MSNDNQTVSPQTRPLYKFAYVHRINERLAELKDAAEQENWTYANTESAGPLPVLYSYFHYTFNRVEEQGKIAITDDRESACFNTGLVTDFQEPIFALFSKNAEIDREPWRFVKFMRKGENDASRFPQLPEMATYFSDPSKLVYDPRNELRVNYEHIISDNKGRFPEPFRSMENHQLQLNLKGAVENAIERVRRNYKAAVPQFHRDNIQLLLPLCLSNAKKADLAMVVEEKDEFYRAATCLTIDMAYNNARLLARPDRDWLQP